MSNYDAALNTLKNHFDMTKDLVVAGEWVELTKTGFERMLQLILDSCRVFTEGYILFEAAKEQSIISGDPDLEFYNGQEAILVELASYYGNIMSALTDAGIKVPNLLVIMLDSTLGHHPQWLDTIGVAWMPIVAVGVGVVVLAELIAYIVEQVAEYYSAADYNKNVLIAAKFPNSKDVIATLKKAKVEDFKIQLIDKPFQVAQSIASNLPILAAGAIALFFLMRRS
ncbi:MAG: hypothetical protein WC477_07385 [Patescibacteria group bacterium]